MSYDGLEIDMLSLGDADSIIITRWNSGTPERILIDGGWSSSVAIVRSFLRKHGITTLDHVVCSHPHDDHAGGLVELLKDKTLTFGRLWMHIPDNHVDVASIKRVAAAYSTKNARIITESVKTEKTLLDLAVNRGIPVDEPFADADIGFLKVCGPSTDFYTEMISQLTEGKYYADTRSSVLLEQLEDLVEEPSESLLENPTTDPLNNTSTILATKIKDDVYVFTADAGAEALAAAMEAYKISGCKWMQIPHHGSRRNITQGLIEAFSPKTAFVSADGNKKHPKRAVVNAFKNQGSKVYSTHYPNGRNLCQPVGSVPERTGQISATPLWEAK